MILTLLGNVGCVVCYVVLYLMIRRSNNQTNEWVKKNMASNRDLALEIEKNTALMRLVIEREPMRAQYLSRGGQA